MRVTNSALLLAAVFAHSVSSAALGEIRNGHAARYYPLNGTTTSKTSLSASQIQIPDSTESSVAHHDAFTTTTLVAHADTRPSAQDQSSQSLDSNNIIDSSARTSVEFLASTQSSAVHRPNSSSSRFVHVTTNGTSTNHSNHTLYPATTFTPNITSTTPVSTCTQLQDDAPVTEYSIVFTATVTFFGNRSAYTPPYPTIETPVYCGTGTLLPSITFGTSDLAGEATAGFPGSQPAGLPSSVKHAPTSCPEAGCVQPEPPSFGQTTQPALGNSPPAEETESSSRVVVTFVTTDKNPAVVFPSDPVPRFGQTRLGGRLSVHAHQTVAPHQTHQGSSGNRAGSHSVAHGQAQFVPGGSQTDKDTSESTSGNPAKSQSGNGNGPSEPKPGNQGGSGSAASTVQRQSQPAYTVTARGAQVIINGQTYSNLKPDQTKTITAGKGVFTIYPTAVIGQGETVTKPEPVGTAVSAVKPTSAMLGGLPVVVTGSEAIIGGTRIKMPPEGTTTRVSSEDVSITPGKIIIDGQTLTFRAAGARQTDVVVTGGEMMTAIGRSIYVFHSTTLTYGPGIKATTEVVDDDTITIGPSGVIVKGTTMGGPSAETTATSYEIVGGATITKLSPSLAVVGGKTFTVGPNAKSTTTVIGGETITFDSEGVIISTMTLSYPFGSSVVTTIQQATGTSDDDDAQPTETGSSKSKTDDDDEDGDSGGDSGGSSKTNDDSSGHLQKPSLVAGITGLCIAMGVWIFM